MSRGPNERAPIALLPWEEIPRKLDVNETAAIWGRSTRTVRRAVSEGLIRATRPGGGPLLIDRESLRAFLEGAEASAA